MIAKNLARSLFYPQLLLVCLVCWVIGSEPGLKSLYALVKMLVPGDLQIETIHGRLIHTMTFNNVRYHSPPFSLQAKKITLDGQLSALFNHTFKLPALVVEQAQVKLSDTVIWIEKASLNLEARWDGQMFLMGLKEVEGTYQNQSLLGTGHLLFLNKRLIEANAQVSWGKIFFKLDTKAPEKIQWQINQKPYQAMGDLSFSTHQGLRGTGRFTLPGKEVALPLPRGETHFLKFEQNWITVDLTESGLNWQMLFKENQSNYLEGYGAIPNFTLSSLWKEAAVFGNFKGKLNDFSLVYRITPVVSRIKGNVDMQASLSGSLKNPRLDLHITLDRGQCTLPKQRITLHHLQGKIQGSIPGNLEVTTAGRIEESHFQLTGLFNPLALDGNTQFSFQGQRLKLYNTPSLSLVASPDVLLTYQNKKIQVEGEVVVPEGDIRLIDETKQAIHSQDVVLLDPAQSTIDHTDPLFPKIHFVIQDKVHFTGYGLDTRVGGKLWVERRSDGLYTGLGRLTLKEGKYRLPGAMGYIHRGRLLFPVRTLLYNPLLDIRIIQKPIDQLDNTIETGLYVQGSLQRPSYQLYSNQALQQAEILSRLGFAALEQQSDNYQRQLLSQSTMLVNSTTNPLFSQLQTKLGLEEIGIQSQPLQRQRSYPNSTTNDSLLVLGKSFSKRLYLQFLQSTLDPISIVRLKYFITPKTAISAEKSNEEMGLDLSFSIEKD